MGLQGQDLGSVARIWGTRVRTMGSGARPWSPLSKIRGYGATIRDSGAKIGVLRDKI